MSSIPAQSLCTSSLLNLSIICFGYRASEISAWIYRHGDILERVASVCGFYHLEDVCDLGSLNYSHLTLKSGHLCPLERIKSSEGMIHTDFVLLCAADDTILELPRYFDSLDIGIGMYHFRSEKEFYPSFSNALEFSSNSLTNFNKYWTFPSPGDNSIFYSIFRKGIFFETLLSLEAFEAWDWVFLSKVLLRGEKVVRLPSLRINRSVTPVSSYTRKVLESFKSVRLDPRGWRMHNPILYALKQVSECVSSPLADNVLECWSRYLEIKFNEMVEISSDYAQVIEKDSIKFVAHKLAHNLGSLRPSEIVFPKIHQL
jgi:hypothetical protein